jgi:cytochrome c553
MVGMARLLLLAAAAAWAQGDLSTLLRTRCAACHNASAPGGLNVLDAASVDSNAARIVEAVSAGRMPKGGSALGAPELAVVRGGLASKVWWSLRPLPAPKAGSIDSFIRAELTRKRLTPSPEADRRTLLRRVTFDLHGLPPTPEDVRAFERDPAPDAFEKVVDRLLASPRYGERWARHWLDVVHYGESHGYDKDKPRDNAWPYRDWVINALNADIPYTQFVEQQLAADVLHRGDPRSVPALGFLAAGPWDFVGHQELREGTTDKTQTRLLDRDDVVAQTMSSFVSMTAHCARCHNHKFDPIPQIDYYRLQAVFAGVDRADRPFDDDPAVYAKRLALLERKREAQRHLQPLLDKVESASSPALVDVDNRIRDARSLITHIGEPKSPADDAEKKTLLARVERDNILRKQILDALVGEAVYASIAQGQAEVKRIAAEIAALPAPRLVYAGTSLFDRMGNFRPALEPRPIHLLGRGSVSSPGDLVDAGALSCLPSVRFEPAQDEGARRAALARWITANDNVLTWRSIVNRVWHYHFGTGLVDTPNDFGRMGGKPSHPELLDWLAVWFRDEARGSLKQLHRAIVTSAAYKQSSANREDAAKLDADNRLLWRMNRARLDAESVRDAVLQTAGKLDLTMGGPSVRMFWFKNDHSPIYDYARFDPATPGANRRSVYRFLVRSVADPFMDRLDCPDPSLLAPKRSTTLTAIQALALWNNPFMIRMSGELAERAKSVDGAVELVWQRKPTPQERAAFDEYARKHGMASLARLLLNTNEFLFVD